jgi:hypothetical protein
MHCERRPNVNATGHERRSWHSDFARGVPIRRLGDAARDFDNAANSGLGELSQSACDNGLVEQQDLL